MAGKSGKYKRILLKLSGEALQGSLHSSPIDSETVDRIASELSDLNKNGIQIGVVIGAGNFFRGNTHEQLGLERVITDQMGMVSTVLNALVLRSAIERFGSKATILSAISMNGIVEQYNRIAAIHALDAGIITIFSGGTGNPLVTTDSAASLRSIEINADILLKATNVDGVYSEDPKKNKNATLLKKLSYQEVLKQELGVMDLAAFTQCRDYSMPIRVFNIDKKNAISKIIAGEDEGSLVC
ncbi:MAG: UMP kinase [Gammaproteobacteria bacterium]|nr:UMP kinase [Gammaproteobacteria bacterium]